MHAVISHRSSGQPLTIEGAIVRVADALDMAKGRSRVEFEAGRLNIHSISAYAIDEVRIEAGDDKAVRVEIEMSNSAGIFQVDEGLGKKLRGTPLAEHIEVIARIEGEHEKRLVPGLPPVMRALVWQRRRGVAGRARAGRCPRRRRPGHRGAARRRARALPSSTTSSTFPTGGSRDAWRSQASGAGWRRSLTLEHDGRGRWTADGERVADVDGALDCDLAFSPLTNLMPVRRSALHERAGSEDFVMAWVSVPDLRVHASPQRYEHVRPGVVRYVALDGDFTAELELDEDGLVVRYPRLAERVGLERRTSVFPVRAG